MGRIERFKARLVAKDFTQREGIDFSETFFPVARMETIRIVLSMAAHYNWLVYQFDIKSVFLNDNLLEDVYVSQSQRFIIEGKEEKVYKLKKALYRLKQAPRAWYSRINAYFCENGFQRSASEPTLYIKMEGKDQMLVVCLYIDDIIYTGSSASLIKEFREKMMLEFEMSDLGALHYFLGLKIKQTRYLCFTRKVCFGFAKKVQNDRM